MKVLYPASRPRSPLPLTKAGHGLSGVPRPRYKVSPIVLVVVLVLDLFARERYQSGWFYRLRLFRSQDCLPKAEDENDDEDENE